MNPTPLTPPTRTILLGFRPSTKNNFNNYVYLRNGSRRGQNAVLTVYSCRIRVTPPTPGLYLLMIASVAV